MSTQTFPESRRIFGWIWLTIGVIGLIGLAVMATMMTNNLEVTQEITLDNAHILSLVFFWTFMVVSGLNKIMKVRHKINFALLLVGIISPVLWGVFDSISQTTKIFDESLANPVGSESLITWGLIYVIWIVGWWISDIADLIKYGLPTTIVIHDG